MKKTICLLALAVACLAACRKTTTNNYYGAQLPSFAVNGIQDAVLYNDNPSYDAFGLYLTVNYNDSSQNTVTLSLSPLPQGITLDSTYWLNVGIPTFSTYLVLYDTSQAGATPGSYPMTLTATSSSNEKKTYTFDIIVKASPPCTANVVGKYVNCSAICASTAAYADSVYNDANVPNRVWFTNFANLGIKVYGTMQCSYNEIAIPSQTVSGINYSGYLYIEGTHYLSGGYTAGSTSCNVTMQ